MVTMKRMEGLASSSVHKADHINVSNASVFQRSEGECQKRLIRDGQQRLRQAGRVHREEAVAFAAGQEHGLRGLHGGGLFSTLDTTDF